MITLQANPADISKIDTELMLKVGGIKELSSSVVLTELANAVFTLSAKAFKKAMDIEAKANPKAFHHVYEWNQTGLAMGRLFYLYKQDSANGKLIIKTVFSKSKNKVPVDPRLLQPGKTGKGVVSKSVFANKADVMESGRPIIYRASKNIPLPDSEGLRFIAAGTLIKNPYPGGKEVKGSFEKFFHYWFDTKVDSVIKSSGVINLIDNETAKVLARRGAGSREVRNAILSLLRQYSQGQNVI